MADEPTPDSAVTPDPAAEGATPNDSPSPEASPEAAGTNWRDALGEELAGSPALKDIKDPTELAQQFVDLQGHLGSSIRIPSEHASEEDKAAFRAKLKEKVPELADFNAEDPEAFAELMQRYGAPSDPSHYTTPESVSKLDQTKFKPIDGFNDWASEANLTQSQYNTLVERFTEAQVNQAERTATEHNAKLEILHREWGFAYDEKVEQAANLARLTGAPEEMVGAITEGRVQPEVLRWLSNLADSYGGEADIGADRGNRAPELTTREAQAQLDEIMTNREHVYWTGTPGTPEKERATELVLKLREKAMGKASRAPHAVLGQQYD